MRLVDSSMYDLLDNKVLKSAIAIFLEVLHAHLLKLWTIIFWFQYQDFEFELLRIKTLQVANFIRYLNIFFFTYTSYIYQHARSGTSTCI